MGLSRVIRGGSWDYEPRFAPVGVTATGGSTPGNREHATWAFAWPWVSLAAELRWARGERSRVA